MHPVSARAAAAVPPRGWPRPLVAAQGAGGLRGDGSMGGGPAAGHTGDSALLQLGPRVAPGPGCSGLSEPPGAGGGSSPVCLRVFSASGSRPLQGCRRIQSAWCRGQMEEALLCGVCSGVCLSLCPLPPCDLSSTPSCSLNRPGGPSPWPPFWGLSACCHQMGSCSGLRLGPVPCLALSDHRASGAWPVPGHRLRSASPWGLAARQGCPR